MEYVKSFIEWCMGGTESYMPAIHCMRHDWLWISVTIFLNLGTTAGYFVIAWMWSQQEKLLPPCQARSALRSLKHIFVLCATCGYCFMVVKMWFPVWRLYDLAMVPLLVVTWVYISRARGLKFVYQRLVDANSMEQRLTASNDAVDQYRTELRRKGFFFNAISHDLRAPLNAVSLNAQLVTEALKSGDMELMGIAAEAIQTSSAAASEMLAHILEFARVGIQESNEISTLDVGETLVEVCKTFNEQAKLKGLTLTAPLAARREIRTDAMKVRRILNNLVDNAIKFTENGSVDISLDQCDSEIRVCVRDTGSGISPEHSGLLFGEFYQIANYERNRLKGFGMGLAISRALARQLGGELTLLSSSDKGSCFQLTPPGGIIRELS